MYDLCIAPSTHFGKLVKQDPKLAEGNATLLPCHVATRWNSDCVCLAGHLRFKAPVQWLTSNPAIKLRKYTLTESQWDLAVELYSVLEVFQEPTDRFLQSEVPLIHKTIPKMLTLCSQLLNIQDNALNQNLCPATHVAAEAALQIWDKYMDALEESDLYILSAVMCPDHKLKWFSDRGIDTNPI
ncbi:hypothetical protein FRC07_003227 [Ceratobasidium sp. 392]|nr:hypothetical protein FRC07_003227 [Ceratobasidium sp. 392]